MSPTIPDDQLARIQPVVDALLAELRQRTQLLTAETGYPYDFDPEAGE